jgi:DGQHR domain-containing protein
VSNGPNGYIVDGQQRFMALSSIKTDKKFEVFVAGFICDSINELQKQFILINNTKPLPKALIYELLPKIDGLPQRMSSRSIASQLTEVLNYTDDSSLKGLIFQQTNPYGVIRDTAIQKVIMNSLSDGALRPMLRESDSLERAFRLISNFFEAVKEVFHEEWNGHTPKTSRLIHAAGIVSMGYVMETLYSMNGTTNTDDFLRGLEYLKGKTAWSEGYWEFDQEERRVWNSIQYVPRDVRQLAQYLISIVRRTATDIE